MHCCQADARAAEAASFHFKSSSDGHKIELMLGKAMDSMEKVRPTTSVPYSARDACCLCVALRT